MARRPPPRRPSKAGQKPSAGSSREPSRAKQAASSISTEQVARAKDFFRQFEVALKNAALYSHKKEQFHTFMKQPFEALRKYIGDFGALKLTVKPLDFFLGDLSIFHDESGDNNLCYKFYREGFRTLTFNEQITLDEMVSLLEVMILSTRDLNQEDMTTRLWKLNLSNFEYLILEGLDGDEAEKNEVDKAVAFIHQLVHTDSTTAVNFRGIADEDFMLEKSLAGAQSKRGLKKKVQRVPEQEQASIQKLLAEEQDELPTRLVELALFVVSNANNTPDLKSLYQQLSPICEFLLMSRHLDALSFLIKDVFEIGQELKPQLRTALLHFQEELHRYLGSNELLLPVVQMLQEWNLLEKKQQEALIKYLKVLGPRCSDALFDKLATANSPTRRALLNILLDNEDERSSMLQSLLNSYGDDANFMLDLLGVGREIPNLFDLESLQQYLVNPSAQVRMEGLLTLGVQYPMAAKEAAQPFLQDSEGANRRVAVEVLSKIKPDGLNILRTYIDSPDFPKLDVDEQVSVFRFMGRSNDKDVLFWFGELLEQKSGFFTRRVNQFKELAIQGLQSSSEGLAHRLLKKSMEAGKHSKEVKRMLEKAVQTWS